MFKCEKCGLCCRNIAGITELKDFDDGSGVCVHLTEDNLCDIYSFRPDICNVEIMYDKYYSNVMSRDHYEALNMECCRYLQSK